jgi:hypothetical protein
MVSNSKTQRVFANKQGEVTLVCPNCSNAKSINIAKYRSTEIQIQARCGCGYIFEIDDIRNNLRRFYRKKTNLNGTYLRVRDETKGVMKVVDLSYSGIRFKMEKEDDIETGEILGVRFILNNEKKTEVNTSVVVKNKQGYFIGAEFCNSQAYEMELTDYLLLY